MTRISFLPIAFASLMAIGCSAENRNNTASSESVGTAGETDRHDIAAADKDFVTELAVGNMAEVELGKLAVERSANAEVKKFGQTMIDDHTKAGNTLKSVASAHNISIPTDLDDKHRELRDKLAKLQGADFDREYMAAMVEGHQDVADKLEPRIDKEKPAESDNAVTMVINQWAADAYPVVQAHLEAAKALADTVKRRG
jgi:putative membrane protein